MRLRSASMFLAVSLVVTAVAGCSGRSAPDARGITASTIKVAGIAPLTATGGGYPGADVGAAARYARANREGGVHGRMIDYVATYDDNQDGSKNLDLTKKAVEQDGVFAVVPMLGAGFTPPSSLYTNEQRVPTMGWGFMPGQCSGQPDYNFGFNGCLTPADPKDSRSGIGKAATGLLGQGLTVAIVANDSAASRNSAATVRQTFTEAGARVIYDQSNVPLAEQVDYTPFAQAVMRADGGKPPQLVFFSCYTACVLGVSNALKAAGYPGAVLTAEGYSPGLLTTNPEMARALDGAYILLQFQPLEAGGAEVDRMLADFEAHSPGFAVQFGAILGYLMADVFLQMLDAVGEDLTPERFSQVVNGGFTYRPQGDKPLLGPVSFPEGHGTGTSCMALVQVSGVKYTVAKPMTCY